MMNYGLRVLVAACDSWAGPGAERPPDVLLHKVNQWLDDSHKLDLAKLSTIRLELKQQENSGIIVPGSVNAKQRDNGDFEKAVENAFITFREQEREILLNVPGDSRPEMGKENIDAYIVRTKNEKWWWAAAHMRHYLEFLFVLKGLKPCVRHTDRNHPIFSTVVLDSLVPLMDRLDLWSYGFRLGFRDGEWVLYDARSPKRSQVEKIFLTPTFVREMDQTGAFAAKDRTYHVPDLEVAHALGYPIPSDAVAAGHVESWIQIRDVSEMEELERLGRPQPSCCVQGMIYCCIGAEEAGEENWKEVLAHFFKCERVADGMGTELGLFTLKNYGMTAWLQRNPGWLFGRSTGLGFSGPRLFSFMGEEYDSDLLDSEDYYSPSEYDDSGDDELDPDALSLD